MGPIYMYVSVEKGNPDLIQNGQVGSPKTSVVDPGPFLTPGSGMEKNPDPRSRINGKFQFLLCKKRTKLRTKKKYFVCLGGQESMGGGPGTG
jgi:hypothetical protein